MIHGKGREKRECEYIESRRRRGRNDRLVINVKAVMPVSRETNERMARECLKNRERTDTSDISALPFVLRAFIFHLCAYVPQSQAPPSIIYEFYFVLEVGGKKKNKTRSLSSNRGAFGTRRLFLCSSAWNCSNLMSCKCGRGRTCGLVKQAGGFV